jgi:hypothetical protein
MKLIIHALPGWLRRKSDTGLLARADEVIE